MKNTRAVSLFLVVIMLCSLMLTACHSDKGATPDEATTTATSNASSEETDSTDKTDHTSTEASNPSSGNNQNSAGGNSSGGQQSGNYDEPQETQAPAKPNSDTGSNVTPTRLTITTGNKGYTANVGDTVTYVCNLKTPDKIEDVQATVTYDSSMLQLTDIDFPVLGDLPIYNTDLQNEVKFNAIKLKGFDFTTEGSLVTIKFKVLKKGGTAIATALEVMSEVGTGDPYVTNYTLADGVVVKEVIKK